MVYLPSTYETFICSIMNTLNETIATFGVAELWKLSPQRKRDFEEIFIYGMEEEEINE